MLNLIVHLLYVKTMPDDVHMRPKNISEMFVTPIRTTICGHNFCEKCLIDLRRNQGEWACPECRHLHNCSIETLTRAYFIEKMVEKFKAKQRKQPVPLQRNRPGNCGKHNRAFEISELYSFEIMQVIHVKKHFSGCLEHAHDLCADCHFEKICGKKTQTDKCNFIKIQDKNILVQDETAKIKGKVDFNFNNRIPTQFYTSAVLRQ